MPDYFPALTRLAYLYYKKGYSAKAIDTWRRSLHWYYIQYSIRKGLVDCVRHSI